MTEPLRPEHFARLADAYGGDIDRWPEGHREQARAMAALADPSVLLAQARRLDERLEAWRAPAPSAALRERIATSRPVHLSRRWRIWLSGLGIATALAGAIAGSAGATILLPISGQVPSDDATAFGDPA